MDHPSNLQCDAILSGLRELETILRDPLASSVLELTKQVETKEHKDLLGRLRASLEQYVDRIGNNLIYVAFIGHFSSGKSSTINSLLDLWDSDQKRTVDQNPTDKIITLITDKKNANSLLGMAQGSIPVRLETPESDLLKSLVFADTPGSGEPQVLMENMARDFLPVCDLVLFFFSAANPLDKSDEPLLLELDRRLPFIPILFVLTRADDFSINPREPVSNENIDHANVARFQTQLLSRINVLLKPKHNYTQEHLILVDNKATFNIPSLKEILLKHADPANTGDRLMMHSHKVHFFQRSGEELRDFFAGFLSEKLRELNELVGTANKNILKYNEVVMISNNAMTQSWVSSRADIDEAKARAIERAKEIDDPPSQLTSADRVSSSLSNVRSQLLTLSRIEAGQIERHVMQTGFLELQKQLREVQTKLWDPELDTLKAEDVRLDCPTISWDLRRANTLSASTLFSKADDHRKLTHRFTETRQEEIDKVLDDINRAIHSRGAITKCESIVNGAQSSLDDDLERYFQIVEVYRAGVFARSTKDSIEKLGIGGELDKREAEFTETDKDTIKLRAKQALFPSFAEGVATATTNFAGITDRVKEAQKTVRAIDVESPPSLEDKIKTDLTTRLPEMLSSIEADLQAGAEKYMLDAQLDLQKVAASVILDYQTELSSAKRSRRNRYTTVATLTASLLLIAYILYVLVKGPAPQSFGSSLLLGVGVSVVGSFIVVILLKAFDNFPRTKRTIADAKTVNLRDGINNAIEALVERSLLPTMEREKLSAKLFSFYSDVVFPKDDSWQIQLERQYQEICRLTTNAKQIRRDYIAHIETLTKACAAYFEDAAKNLETLKTTAQTIKERAIEPSFDLLEQTSATLRSVKDQITAIDFR